MNMGERIKKLRIEKGLTQEELGKYIGVQKSAIRKYEKGDVQNLKRNSIEILANLFNVTPSYLMCLEDENKQESQSAVVLIYGTIPAGIAMECIEDIIDTEEISADMLKGGKQYFRITY